MQSGVGYKCEDVFLFRKSSFCYLVRDREKGPRGNDGLSVTDRSPLNVSFKHKLLQ